MARRVGPGSCLIRSCGFLVGGDAHFAPVAIHPGPSRDCVNPWQDGLAGPVGMAHAMDAQPRILQKIVRLLPADGLASEKAQQSRADRCDEHAGRVRITFLIAPHPTIERDDSLIGLDTLRFDLLRQKSRLHPNVQFAADLRRVTVKRNFSERVPQRHRIVRIRLQAITVTVSDAAAFYCATWTRSPGIAGNGVTAGAGRVIEWIMTLPVTERRVARALRVGGTEVIEIGVEELPPLKAHEALVRVEAAGLNHVETLIRSGQYVVRLPFPYNLGGEGAGVVVAAGVEAALPEGTRVCWGAVLGSCATFVIAPASMLTRIPDELNYEAGASLAVAALTAGGLARVWPLAGRTAVVWGAAGAVGRMLVALLADRGAEVIGIASGAARTEAVLSAGARHAVDRASQDVREAVRACTGGRGADAVFDPIGAPTWETSLQLLAPRGCLINYGELSGPAPEVNLHQLFAGSVFVTKYNGMRWVEGPNEFASLVSQGLAMAVKRRAAISDVAGRFSLDRAAEAYRLLESGAAGKVLVLPTAAA